MTGFSEGGGVPPAKPPNIDTTRRVFKVPIEYLIHADLYVLATDLVQARIKAEQMDFEELVGFDTEHFWVDSERRLKLNDIGIHDVHTISAKPIDRVDYDPADHPDWVTAGKL